MRGGREALLCLVRIVKLIDTCLYELLQDNQKDRRYLLALQPLGKDAPDRCLLPHPVFCSCYIHNVDTNSAVTLCWNDHILCLVSAL